MESTAPGIVGAGADNRLRRTDSLFWDLRRVRPADRVLHALVRPLQLDCCCGSLNCGTDRDVPDVRNLVPGPSAKGPARKHVWILDDQTRVAGCAGGLGAI